MIYRDASRDEKEIADKFVITLARIIEGENLPEHSKTSLSLNPDVFWKSQQTLDHKNKI